MRFKNFFFGILAVIVLTAFLPAVFATIELGNLSNEITASYTPLQPVKGWINISLNNEPSVTLISGFNNNLTIKEFLEKNNFFCSLSGKCSCLPKDCKDTYSVVGDKNFQKNYSMKIATTNLFGIKLTDNISQISEFKFNVSTNAGNSCLNPVMIDLLDNGIDWKSNQISNDECFIKNPFGCYNSSHSNGTVSIGTDKLCEKISLPPAGGFKIGAKISGNGSSSFTLSLEFGGVEKRCNANISSREASCKIVLDQSLTNSNTEAEVCIFSNNPTNYKINFEDNQPCGYILQSDSQKFPHDYEIFALPLKYSSSPKFSFSQNLFENNITNLIFNYINDRYNLECNPECIIPIRIYAGINQNIVVSNLSLSYNVRGHPKSENGFYDVGESPALMSSEFLKLDLEKANILTPKTSANLILKIGNLTITKNISITNMQIKRIVPERAGLLVTTLFVTLLESNASNVSYTWDFGDGTVITTKENKVQHTYSNATNYQLKVNVSNKDGEAVKIITVKVSAGYETINSTIKDYKKKLNDAENNLLPLPDWIQSNIRRIENIDELKSEVDRLEKNFKESLQENFPKIMTDLNNLNLPYKIAVTQIIKPSKFIQNVDRLDLSILEEEMSIDETKDKQDYHDSINKWMLKNLDSELESRTYSSYYEDGEKILLSSVKLNLIPKKEIEEIYIMIFGSQIKFKEDYSEKEIANGFLIRIPLNEAKIIEFLHTERTDILNPPIYILPNFKELEFGVEEGVCRINNFCEKERGENSKNCHQDCKPWKLTTFLLGLLFFIALTIYIILQEWYKRHYESHLFKDKNQLFNLITFMNNTVKQNLSKNQIFQKLRALGWSNEQLNYAWNKLHGKRNGMWEIPIFLHFEKKKVQTEINKRQFMINKK